MSAIERRIERLERERPGPSSYDVLISPKSDAPAAEWDEFEAKKAATKAKGSENVFIIEFVKPELA